MFISKNNIINFLNMDNNSVMEIVSKYHLTKDIKEAEVDGMYFDEKSGNLSLRIRFRLPDNKLYFCSVKIENGIVKF